MNSIQLKSIFHYDPVTGIFTRLSNGKIVTGARNSRGHYQICINYKRYLVHRLAWLYMFGVWPRDQIDHINLDKSDNRISNLRESNNSQNNRNRGKLKSNNSGYIGVSRVKNKWRVNIRTDVGVITEDFNCIIEAARRRDELAILHHGEFAVLNFPQ